MRWIRFAWWNAIHNLVAHPLMAWPFQLPKWVEAFHDWTAKKAYGIRPHFPDRNNP